MTITAQDIRELVGSNNFFGVTFTKKTTGETRHMLAHPGMKKNLKGGARAYDPDDKGLMWVTDVNVFNRNRTTGGDLGRRSVNIAGIQEIRARGKRWIVRNDKLTESNTPA